MSLDRDYDILILSRLIPILPGSSPGLPHSPQSAATPSSSTPPSISNITLHNKSRALLERVKDSCTTPGNECFLSDLRVGLPAFCAYLASSTSAAEVRAGGPGVTLEKAQIEACLTRQDFIRGVGIVARAAGMQLPVIPPQPQPQPQPQLKPKPNSKSRPPTLVVKCKPLSSTSASLSRPSKSQANINRSLSPSSSRSLSHTQIIQTQRTSGDYGYNLLEPLFAPRRSTTRALSAMASVQAVRKGPDAISQPHPQSMNANPSGARPNGGEERPKKRRRTEGAGLGFMSGMQEIKDLQEENLQLRHRINSLQHLLQRERFDREERDIEEHHELTVLRTALVRLLGSRPVSSNASTSTAHTLPLPSTSPSDHANSMNSTNGQGQAVIDTAAEAIGAVERMARRRLIITDLPDVETYDFEDQQEQEEKRPEEDEGESDDDDEQSLDDDVRMDDEPTPAGPAAGTGEGGKKVQKKERKKKKKKQEKETRQQSESSSSDDSEDPMTAAVFEDGDVPEAGTMVWARLPSHPWYPAVVYDEGPANIMESRPRSRGKDKDKNYCLVNFFDERKSWAWLLLPAAPNRLRMFGYSDVLDGDMVAEDSRLQATQQVWRKAAFGGRRGGGGRWGKKEREKVLTAVRAATENMAPEDEED